MSKEVATAKKEDFTSIFKELLADSSKRIVLHDVVLRKTRETLEAISGDQFSLDAGWDSKEFNRRLQAYEAVESDLLKSQILLAYWGSLEFRESLTKPLRSLAYQLKPGSGLAVWSNLRWYPIYLLFYATGIAAVSSKNYGNLWNLFDIRVPGNYTNGNEKITTAFYDFLTNLNDVFKLTPGRERNFVPRSEYMYSMLQPIMDDLLFLGPEYEQAFDEFEVLFALEFASEYEKMNKRIWAPVGRFGWKHKSHHPENGPLHQVITQALELKDKWKPLESGLFDGSFERFKGISNEYLRLADGLPFY